MFKVVTSFLFSVFIAGTSFSQIVTTNPGSFNWNDPSAWVGNAIPSSGQMVEISDNSIITLNSPVVHNNTVIVKGELLSIQTTNDLEIQTGNLSVFSTGVVDFASVNNVPITISVGGLGNTGEINCGNLTCNSGDNSGELNIYGNLNIGNGPTLTGPTYTSDLYVQGDININNGSLNVIEDTAIVQANNIYNSGGIRCRGAIQLSGSFVSSGWVHMELNSELIVQQNFENHNYFSNNSAEVIINGDFYNYGTITSYMYAYNPRGTFEIASYSENGTNGIIEGRVDICDLTLTGGSNFDMDLNPSGVNLDSVSFCNPTLSTIQLNDIDIDIFPNPSAGQVKINSDYNIQNIIITNMSGVKIKQVEFQSQLDLNLPSGNYLIQFVSNEVVIKPKKLIIL
jgi:hypothetical protein